MKRSIRPSVFVFLTVTALLVSLLGAVWGPSGAEAYDGLNIFAFILVGFAAQMIDGALGMAYGVSSNTFLLSLGLPPASASASVHMAEVFTTGVSGLSHWKLKNIDLKLAEKLLVPGVLGGVSGAYLLTSLDGNLLKPWISAYLLVMGIVILYKAFNGVKTANEPVKNVRLLGLLGGFFDAIGGGGWGPVVTTTLVARGNNARISIGTVNFSEFFVTFAQSVTFILSLNFSDYWQVIVGLLLGGVIAAPLAAHITKNLPLKILMTAVGVVIVALSLRTIWMALF